MQFVGFRDSQMGTDVVIQESTSQQKLCANVVAQIVAFACGKADEDRNKNFEGVGFPGLSIWESAKNKRRHAPRAGLL